MNLFVSIGAWFSDPTNWSGSIGVPQRILEHLEYTVATLLIAIIIGVCLGAFVGHTGKGGFLVVGLANLLRALPTLGLLTLVVLAVGIGATPAVTALVILAIPPILAGTYSGIRTVDRDVVDAARGVGMRELQILFRVEIPNAMPLIFSGIRSSALQVVATATVAAYVALGGLGRYVIDGLNQRDYAQMASGAILVAALAIIVDIIFIALQRLVISPGLRPTGGKSR